MVSGYFGWGILVELKFDFLSAQFRINLDHQSMGSLRIHFFSRGTLLAIKHESGSILHLW
jgi:hypothetical protein